MIELFSQILFGWVLADLIGGLVHWWEDRAADSRWPFIGRLVVEPNRAHHRRPSDFVRSTFLSRNLTTFVAAGAASLCWALVLGPSPIWAAATVGGMIQNQVHFWTHAAAPTWVRVLQDMGLFQSPRQHGEHHRYETRRYCVLTNFLNPPLDALGFWDTLETCLLRLRLPVNGGTR